MLHFMRNKVVPELKGDPYETACNACKAYDMLLYRENEMHTILIK